MLWVNGSQKTTLNLDHDYDPEFDFEIEAPCCKRQVTIEGCRPGKVNEGTYFCECGRTFKYKIKLTFDVYKETSMELGQ